MEEQRSLNDLRASLLSEMVEERQLRYVGHVFRYPEDRLTRFMLFAERPTPKWTGTRKQWVKERAATLERRGLDTGMMLDRNEWRKRLEENFPRPIKDSGKR